MSIINGSSRDCVTLETKIIRRRRRKMDIKYHFGERERDADIFVLY